MDEGKIAGRYAKALIGLARDKKIIDAVRVDIETIQHFFDIDPRFNQMLNKNKGEAGIYGGGILKKYQSCHLFFPDAFAY